ncbi:MAG: hypothetical protein RL208_540 [Pseudomonadota bacterium]|jgi:MFS family permease
MLLLQPIILSLLLSCAMTAMLSGVPVNVINQLIEHFGGNEKAIFVVQLGISISSLITGLTSLFLSYNTKWHSKNILMQGLLIIGIVGFLSGFTTNPILFIFLRSILGIGCAMTFAGALHIMRHILPYEKQGNFYALNSLFISINMISVALMAKMLISYNKSLYLFGYYLIALIPVYFVFKTVHNPEQHHAQAANGHNSSDVKSSLFDICKFWFGFFAIFSITCSFNVVLFNVPILIQDLALSHHVITKFMVFYSIFGIIFSFIGARLINVIGTKNVFLLGISVLIAGLKTLSVASSEMWFYAGIVLIGTAAGLSFVNFTVFMQSILDKSKMRFATNMSTAAIYFGFFFASIFSYVARNYSTGGKIPDVIYINYLLIFCITIVMLALFLRKK